MLELISSEGWVVAALAAEDRFVLHTNLRVETGIPIMWPCSQIILGLFC